MTKNELLYQQNLETNRSNLAREVETNRANVANETETNRANLAREAETYRSNVAKEWENLRSNKAKEAETNRANVEREAQTWAQLAETGRANRANESVARRQAGAAEVNAETNRINAQTRLRELANEVDKLDETIRSNQSNEAIRAEANRISDEANSIKQMGNFLSSMDRNKATNVDLLLGQLRIELDKEQFDKEYTLKVIEEIRKYLDTGTNIYSEVMNNGKQQKQNYPKAYKR